jgi:hypothetical protein
VLAGGLCAGGLGLALAPTAQGATPLQSRHGSSAPITVYERLVILDGSMTGHPGWPEFVGSKVVELPAHARVVLTIDSFDTGTAPLANSLRIYDKVEGTLGGTETVNGKVTRSIPNGDVAHTFTVPGIGLNLVVPAASSTKSGAITPAEVTASFLTNKTGSFTWQCYAPCGSGKSGMQGPMATPGFMTGKVVIG